MEKPVDACNIKMIIEFATAVCAALAAILWFISAWWGHFPFTNTPMGLVERYLTLQARFNGAGAVCAGLAAPLQLSLAERLHIFPICRAFS